MQFPHRIDVDCVMQNIAEVLRKIAQFALANKAEFETMVKNSLAQEQTDETKNSKSASRKSGTELNRSKQSWTAV